MPNTKDMQDHEVAPHAERIAKVRARLANLRSDAPTHGMAWPRDLNTQPSPQPNVWDDNIEEPRHG